MSLFVISKTKSTKKVNLIQSINKLFRDIVEEYFPGGFFKWEDYARDLNNRFYSIARSIVLKYLPKKLFDKIKNLDLPQIFSESDLKINEELVNRIILDALLHINDNPSLLKEYLVRSLYSKRDTEEDLKMGDVFFIPRIGHKEYEELKNISPDIKIGAPDFRVLENLENIKEVKWTWKGIDENGLLKFTLPELYGSREFSVKLPKEIPVIKPGSYTFIVKKIVPSRGAVFSFKEQKDRIRDISLQSISEEGLGKDQLLNFINKFIIGYLNEYITKRPVDKVLEDLAGMVSIRGEPISSVSDLAELSGFGETKVKEKDIKKREEVKSKYEESLKEEKEKMQEMINRWFKAPEVVRYFSSYREEDDVNKIVNAISSKFPEESKKEVTSLSSIIKTKPIVKMALKYILSSHYPIDSRRSDWIILVWDAFKNMVFKDPSIKNKVIDLIKGKNKDLIVTDKDIKDFLDSISTNTINKTFFDLRKEIASVIDKAEKTGELPELKSFYDYRKIFRDYALRVIGPYLDDFIEKKGLDPSNPKDVAKMEKFVKERMDLLSDVVKGKSSINTLLSKLEKYANNSIINKLIRQCMINIVGKGLLY